MGGRQRGDGGIVGVVVLESPGEAAHGAEVMAQPLDPAHAIPLPAAGLIHARLGQNGNLACEPRSRRRRAEAHPVEYQEAPSC